MGLCDKKIGAAMCWIARNKGGRFGGDLNVFELEPKREARFGLWSHNDCVEGGCFSNTGVSLPSDADEKLVGRHITWEDEPVELA